MAKFTKSFRGVKNGEIYPTDFVQGTIARRSWRPVLRHAVRSTAPSS